MCANENSLKTRSCSDSTRGQDSTERHKLPCRVRIRPHTWAGLHGTSQVTTLCGNQTLSVCKWRKETTLIYVINMLAAPCVTYVCWIYIYTALNELHMGNLSHNLNATLKRSKACPVVRGTSTLFAKLDPCVTLPAVSSRISSQLKSNNWDLNH
jgi:hypothetical protein